MQLGGHGEGAGERSRGREHQLMVLGLWHHGEYLYDSRLRFLAHIHLVSSPSLSLQPHVRTHTTTTATWRKRRRQQRGEHDDDGDISRRAIREM